MTVQMDRVRHFNRGINEEIHPLIVPWELNYAAGICKVHLVVVDCHQGRIFPANIHRCGVELPAKKVFGVLEEADVRVVTPYRRAHILFDPRNKAGQWLVVTVGGCGISFRLGDFGGGAIVDDAADIFTVVVS